MLRIMMLLFSAILSAKADFFTADEYWSFHQFLAWQEVLPQGVIAVDTGSVVDTTPMSQAPPPGFMRSISLVGRGNYMPLSLLVDIDGMDDDYDSDFGIGIGIGIEDGLIEAASVGSSNDGNQQTPPTGIAAPITTSPPPSMFRPPSSPLPPPSLPSPPSSPAIPPQSPSRPPPSRPLLPPGLPPSSPPQPMIPFTAVAFISPLELQQGQDLSLSSMSLLMKWNATSLGLPGSFSLATLAPYKDIIVPPGATLRLTDVTLLVKEAALKQAYSQLCGAANSWPYSPGLVMDNGTLLVYNLTTQSAAGGTVVWRDVRVICTKRAMPMMRLTPPYACTSRVLDRGSDPLAASAELLSVTSGPVFLELRGDTVLKPRSGAPLVLTSQQTLMLRGHPSRTTTLDLSGAAEVWKTEGSFLLIGSAPYSLPIVAVLYDLLLVNLPLPSRPHGPMSLLASAISTFGVARDVLLPSGDTQLQLVRCTLVLPDPELDFLRQAAQSNAREMWPGQPEGGFRLRMTETTEHTAGEQAQQQRRPTLASTAGTASLEVYELRLMSEVLISNCTLLAASTYASTPGAVPLLPGSLEWAPQLLKPRDEDMWDRWGPGGLAVAPGLQQALADLTSCGRVVGHNPRRMIWRRDDDSVPSVPHPIIPITEQPAAATTATDCSVDSTPDVVAGGRVFVNLKGAQGRFSLARPITLRNLVLYNLAPGGRKHAKTQGGETRSDWEAEDDPWTNSALPLWFFTFRRPDQSQLVLYNVTLVVSEREWRTVVAAMALVHGATRQQGQQQQNDSSSSPVQRPKSFQTPPASMLGLADQQGAPVSTEHVGTFSDRRRRLSARSRRLLAGAVNVASTPPLSPPPSPFPVPPHTESTSSTQAQMVNYAAMSKVSHYDFSAGVLVLSTAAHYGWTGSHITLTHHLPEDAPQGAELLPYPDLELYDGPADALPDLAVQFPSSDPPLNASHDTSTPRRDIAAPPPPQQMDASQLTEDMASVESQGLPVTEQPAAVSPAQPSAPLVLSVAAPTSSSTGQDGPQSSSERPAWVVPVASVGAVLGLLAIALAAVAVLWRRRERQQQKESSAPQLSLNGERDGTINASSTWRFHNILSDCDRGASYGDSGTCDTATSAREVTSLDVVGAEHQVSKADHTCDGSPGQWTNTLGSFPVYQNTNAAMGAPRGGDAGGTRLSTYAAVGPTDPRAEVSADTAKSKLSELDKQLVPLTSSAAAYRTALSKALSGVTAGSAPNQHSQEMRQNLGKVRNSTAITLASSSSDTDEMFMNDMASLVVAAFKSPPTSLSAKGWQGSSQRRLCSTKMEDIVQYLQSELRDADLQVESVLAYGACGVVYRGSWRGLPVAVKTLVVLPEGLAGRQAGGAAERHRVVMEAAISMSLSHPNIVATYTYDLKPLVQAPPELQNGGSSSELHAADDLADVNGDAMCDAFKLYIVQEYCNGGSLRRALDMGVAGSICAGGLPRRVALRLALDVAQGMAHMHSSRIVHGDLKPDNVLLVVGPRHDLLEAEGQTAAPKTADVIKARSDAPVALHEGVTGGPGLLFSRDEPCLCAKVADFGLSQPLAEDATHASKHFKGTPAYMAPEVLAAGQLSPHADVWSFGLLLLELYFGCSLQQAGEVWADLTTSHQEHPRLPQDLLAACSTSEPQYASLVAACLAPQPRDRPEFSDLVAGLEQLQTVGAAVTAAGTA